ncbi:MAG: hypothetical protein FRX48_07498 [Lasallia pustulata]|uniref:Uncharacterized protein n=1 Tax=Lasallia pustulata TaxID=136370 RepID=A0A5M8PHT9_9LECA|nr:MAG: hypothetical protein FRX48_07498 [Lasallia pustulata]
MSDLSKIKKLDGTNWKDWFADIKAECRLKDCWDIMTGKFKAPELPGESFYNGILLKTTIRRLKTKVDDDKTASENLATLKDMCEQPGLTECYYIWKQATGEIPAFTEFKSVADYAYSISQANDVLIAMDTPLHPMLVITAFLHGINKKWPEFVTSYMLAQPKNENGKARVPEFDRLVADTQKYERMQKELEEDKALKASSGGKKCSHCQSTNHNEPTCWKKHPDQVPEGWKPNTGGKRGRGNRGGNRGSNRGSSRRRY